MGKIIRCKNCVHGHSIGKTEILCLSNYPIKYFTHNNFSCFHATVRVVKRCKCGGEPKIYFRLKAGGTPQTIMECPYCKKVLVRENTQANTIDCWNRKIANE